jgi:hypothetical protein
MFDIPEARFETEAATEVAPEDLIEESPRCSSVGIGMRLGSLVSSGRWESHGRSIGMAIRL